MLFWLGHTEAETDEDEVYEGCVDVSDVVAVTEAVGVVAVAEADPVIDPVELAAAGDDVAAAATVPVHISTSAQKRTRQT